MPCTSYLILLGASILNCSVLFVGCRANDPRYMKEHGGPALGPNPKDQRQQSVRTAKIALDYTTTKRTR